MSQGHPPIVFKGCGSVESILLFRNHYYTPVPAFVLNNIQKIPGHQLRLTYKKYLHQQFSVTYNKYLVMSQRHPPIVFKGRSVGHVNPPM